ncbi:hypothetical protein [Limnohabitans sp. Jir72]|uniref:hypothetical protein n=1 Tax=Limnohabitans sp. Jir72 TaxID=1977909 RepID=UPI001304F23E|nr:hypothetical protein [Limnohabitans sp. Jir72]
MTKPITSPVGAAAQNTNAAARMLAAKAPAGFVELSGADLEALTRLQQTLPSSKSSKWMKTEDETFVTGQGTVTDSPEWVMAQAEVTEVVLGGAGGAGGAAGGAAAGAAGGAAAGAGAAGAAAAGAAGAAGAAAVISPLALLPTVALVPNKGSDPAPTPPAPPPEPPPVGSHAPVLKYDTNQTGPVTFKLPVNADDKLAVDMQSHTWSPTDADDPAAHTVFQYYFLVDGSTTDTCAGFWIDSATGKIYRLDSADQSEPVPFCIDQTLHVVVSDGVLVSDPVEVVIDRTLPTFGMLDANTNHSISYMVNNSPTDEHGVTQIVIHEQNIVDGVRDLDKLHADITGSHVITELNFTHQDVTEVCSDGAPVGHNLVAEIDFQNVDLSVTHTVTTVVDQFGTDTSTSVEYVQFQEQATFDGYLLNLYDSTIDPSLNTVNRDEAGFYRLITNHDVNGNLIATDCEDVLAGLEGHDGEILNGMGGNDLIFSHGDNNVLIGGAGDDLLVIGGNQNTIDLKPHLDISNGSDTVVGFFDHEGSQIDLGVTVGDPFINSFTYVDSTNLSDFLNSFYQIGDTPTQTADKIDTYLLNNAVVFELDPTQAENLTHMLGFDTTNLIVPQVFNNIYTVTYSPVVNVADTTTTATLSHYSMDPSPYMAVFANAPIGDFSSSNFVGATNWTPAPVLPV